MKLFAVIIILLGGLLFSMPCVYSSPEYYFKQLSLEEGLSQSTVKCVLSDYKGLIWIGTRFGLNSFDREHMKSYYHQKNNPNSIPFNEIAFLLEDSLLNLWVGTEQALARYDRDKDIFIPITFQGRPITAHSSVQVEKGVLFFERGGVFRYDYQSREVSQMPVYTSEERLSHIDKAHVYDSEKGIILLTCRWNGAWWYHQKTGKLERIPFIEEREIAASWLDSSGCIWISPYAKGVYCYDRQGKVLCHLSADQSLTHDVVLDIKERDGEIWMATDGGGINIYNKNSGKVRSIEHKQGESNSLPVSSFWCLYNDHENNIWAGSVRGGLIGMKEVYMKTYKEAAPNSTYGLSEKAIVSAVEDSDGMIWLGTDGGGVNRLNPQTKQFRHYPSTYDMKVVSIVDNGNGELLLSMFNKGLYVFNKTTGALRELTFTTTQKYKEMYQTGKSVNLNRVDKNRVYLLGDSVYCLNQSAHTLSAVSCRETDLTVSSLQQVVTEDSISYLKGDHALLELNIKQNTLRTLYRMDDSLGVISAVSKDEQGNFWIGTATGLYLYNPASNQLMAIETKRFIGISTLCFDKCNRLWVGTHNMLYAYLLDSKKIIMFGESDGVCANEYIAKPSLVTSSGDIYISGVMGVVYIKNNIPFPENPDLCIQLLDILLDGVSVDAKLNRETNTLCVPWNHTSLAVKAIVKENDLMRKKLFRYYIKGKQSEYIESSDHSMVIHTLPVGSYKILVSCNMKNGDWSAPVELVSVTVLPPWWKSDWFIFTSIFIILGGIGILFWLALKRKENKMLWVMKEHEKKTYEEKISFLINISHELRTPLTLIYAPLKRILNSGTVSDEGLFRQLTDIFKQTRRIRNIINMVLDVRKMEVGGGRLHIQNYSLNEWLQDVAEDFKNECVARNIRFIYNLDNEVGEVPFDAARCEVILSNLLMNALKFSNSDSCITLSTSLLRDTVRISISDQGIGLGNVDTAKLFTRFYQGNHDRQGSGIGLSYAQLLIEMQGGKIGAENNEDKGATFFYELPLCNVSRPITSQPYLNELLISQEQETFEVTDFSIRSYSILIVEDEPELRSYLKEEMKGHFKNVYVAEDGMRALEITNQYLPDIIVSDVMMPRMNGFTLCQQVKSNLEISHIPVILLTARTDTDSAIQGYKQGADVYIPKPFDLEFLLAVVRNQLKNRESIRQRYRENICVISPKEDLISNADETFVLKLNTLIHENINNPDLDVCFVAEQMAMSRATLYNKMKVLSDISIGDYINKFRLTKATQLLTNKDLSILDVSEQCGFTSQRYFSTAFKQAYGTTPSKYRQENI